MTSPHHFPALAGAFDALKRRALWIFPELCSETRRAKRTQRAAAVATSFATNAHAIDYLRALKRTAPGFPVRALALALIEFDSTVEVLRDAGYLLYLHDGCTLIDYETVGPRTLPAPARSFERFVIAASC